ncbi:MAG: hypothetical protein PHV79_00680, partial [Clostridia bacterium]|nr:hypothetical protein [Clostridia bacterium]
MKRVVVSPEKPVQKIKRLPKDYRELKSDENPYIAKLISYIQEKYPYNYVSDNRGNINEALTKRFIAHNLLTDFEDTGDMIQFVKFYASFILSKHGINEIEYYQKSVGLEDSYSTNNYMRENKIHLPLYRFTSSRDIKRLLATMRYIEEDIIYQQNFINGTGLNKKITNPCRFPDRFQVDYANERVRDFFQFLERFVSRPKTVINNETKTYSMDYINSYMIRKNDISQQLAFDSSVSEMNNIYEYLKYVHNNDFVNPAEKEKADSNFEIIKDELFKYNLNSKQQ